MTPRAGLARRAGCASRGRSSRSSCRWRIIGVFVGHQRPARSRRSRALIGGANPALVLVAFLIFYLGFPLRGYRWALLLRGTGFRIGIKDSTEIIFLSWLVNCVVPAKLGDLYRAYLLKINSTASLSRTFGTVFIERCPRPLGDRPAWASPAGYWSFRSGMPQAIQVMFAIAVVVVAILVIGLFTMRNFGRRILDGAAVLPHRDPRVVRPLRGGRLRGPQAAPAARARRGSASRSG